MTEVKGDFAAVLDCTENNLMLQEEDLKYHAVTWQVSACKESGVR